MIPTQALLFNTVLDILTREIRKKKKMKWIQIGEKEVKPVLLADDMILYKENPEDSNKNLLELINKLSKVEGYKINMLKPVVFYTLVMNYQKEKLRKHCHLQLHQEILGIHFTREVKDLYTENFKELIKETKEDTHK